MIHVSITILIYPAIANLTIKILLILIRFNLFPNLQILIHSYCRINFTNNLSRYTSKRKYQMNMIHVSITILIYRAIANLKHQTFANINPT